MNRPRKFLLGSFILVGLQFGWGGCVTEGYVHERDGVYYGPRRDPWFHDDSWVDGHRWYGEPRGDANVEIYIHPPRGRR